MLSKGKMQRKHKKPDWIWKRICRLKMNIWCKSWCMAVSPSCIG